MVMEKWERSEEEQQSNWKGGLKDKGKRMIEHE